MLAPQEDTAQTERLLLWLASCSNDPVAFAYGAFPWGVPESPLEKAVLDPWQIRILELLRDGLVDTNTAIQLAVASGHGVGKSALVAIIILWAFSTAPDTRGVVTANTEVQLKTKTWAELGKWFNLFIGREHFTLTATALFSRDPSRERTWRIDMVPWSEKNTEAFAGLHNKGKRLLLIMDEASAIPDIIHEVAEGALTDADTQIIWIMFGNPTRNSGRFKEAFPGGRFAKFWTTFQVDSRSVAITNKARLQAWIDAYGDDSDFVRIRVKGEFPRQGEMEFFSAAEIDAAMSREVSVHISTPLAIGVDVARFGSNNSVIFFRKGRDARTIERQSYNGIDTVELANRVHAVHNTYRPDGIFIDGGGVGGGVVDNVRRMQLHCWEIQFGSKDFISGVVFDTAGERYANMRSAMYGALRAWMKTGALPKDERLKTTLLAISYTFNKKDEIQLVSKEDLIKDNKAAELILDDADALALTFGGLLAANPNAGGEHPHNPAQAECEYDPFSRERMEAA